eukprot:TRINITY_DN21654_c0_g1_i1.p1 TRINITY_DN21654_c0_g1~~TRINITY_DN21654_c0_g1_i1.p1  ORF type:complete len:759 (+),score=302.97 TRINITY_DN21654_c0_g1_i1:314-2590(+)
MGLPDFHELAAALQHLAVPPAEAAVPTEATDAVAAVADAVTSAKAAAPAADAAKAATEVASSGGGGFWPFGGGAPATPPPPPKEGEIVLDPNTQYLYGLDGKVLVDPMNSQPLKDDWWNSFVGFQRDIIVSIDGSLRSIGVQQAFGWSIIMYTLFIKVAFAPLQQAQLRSTSMMQLLSPKVKEIQEKYQDDPETQQRLLAQLYGVMDVNPLGGCLPTLLTLPVYWSLYGVWRRLYAESFSHYNEGFLWVPSLSQPNPDFKFKLDWLLDFKNAWQPGMEPTMGWHDYICYLIFPALLIGFTVYQQNEAKAAKPKTGGDESQNLVLELLPWLSVYLLGTISLELPQAVSVYYSANTFLTVAQTQLTKNALREEIPGYAEFEKTGKFPDGAFEEMANSSQPPPKTIHEAALRGNIKALKTMIEEGQKVDELDAKKIAPLGFAVAAGQLEAVKVLVDSGADLKVKDGQNNTLLHYAAGYGHINILKELLVMGESTYADNQWAELKNDKNQTVVDAAVVNKQDAVIDFLVERLQLPERPVKKQPPPAPAAAKPEVEEAEVISMGKPDEDKQKAQAALLAAMQGGTGGASSSSTAAPVVDTIPAAAAPAAAAAAAAAAGAPSPQAQEDKAVLEDFAQRLQQPNSGATEVGTERSKQAAAAMQRAVEQLKSNPEQMKKAKEMMSKLPPGMLSMLSGGKMSEDQAKKAMDAMQNMSTEDILTRAETASSVLSGNSSNGAAAAGSSPAAAPAPAAAAAGASKARVVD